MTDDRRPDPLGALRAAIAATGVDLPDGLIEQVLELESEPADQDSARTVIQARLRSLLESSARSDT